VGPYFIGGGIPMPDQSVICLIASPISAASCGLTSQEGAECIRRHGARAHAALGSRLPAAGKE